MPESQIEMVLSITWNLWEKAQGPARVAKRLGPGVPQGTCIFKVPRMTGLPFSFLCFHTNRVLDARSYIQCLVFCCSSPAVVPYMVIIVGVPFPLDVGMPISRQKYVPLLITDAEHTSTCLFHLAPFPWVAYSLYELKRCSRPG